MPKHMKFDLGCDLGAITTARVKQNDESIQPERRDMFLAKPHIGRTTINAASDISGFSVSDNPQTISPL
jgi:hypothetical protein